MTREEIIRMAREAGLLPDNSHPAPETRHMAEKQARLERFAALVAAAAQAEEREACAQEADAHASVEGIAQLIAAAIRARGQA